MQNIWKTFGRIFRGRQHYQELDEEMRLHLELRARKLAATGLSEAEAGYAARRRFGNIDRLQEDCRSSWGLRLWDELRQDSVYALRTLRRDWVFTLTTVLTLTLGIAANTTIFAFIDAMVLRPLPISQPDGLVQLTSHNAVDGSNIPAFCYPIFEGIAQRAQTLGGLFTWHNTQLTLGQGVDSETVSGGVASGNIFATLGLHAQAGRLFTPADDSDSAEPVAVVSDSLWNSRYGRSPSLIGRRLTLNRHSFTVIGVLPAGFRGMLTGNPTSIIIPLHADSLLHPQWDMLHTTRMWWMNVFGRLRNGESLPEASAEIRAFSKPVFQGIGITEINGSPFAKTTFSLVSAAQGGRALIERYDKPLYVLVCVALAVLLIGCFNLANLLLARAMNREKELSLRLTLGASRLRVVRHLVTESLLLSLAGTLLGAVAAFCISRGAAHFVADIEITPDVRLVAFIGGIGALVTILFGLLPAVRSTRLQAAETLKVSRIGRSFERAFIGKVLVSMQVAMSLALVAAAFLFVRSFSTLSGQNIGIDRKNLVFVGLDSEGSGMNPIELAAFYQQLLGNIRALPYVQSASVTAVAPLSGNYAWNNLSEKFYPNLNREQRELYTHQVMPQYFRTVGLPILQGRDFDNHDAASKERIGIVSESAARLYFHAGSALGQLLHDEDGSAVRIVGVVGDAKYQSMRSKAPQTLYSLATKSGELGSTGIMAGTVWNLAVRGSVPAATLTSAVRAMIRKTGRDVSINAEITLDEWINTSLVTDRLLAILASAFALVGCLLTAVGLYGIIAYSVGRRTSEIGLRMALGARRTDVLWIIFGEALTLAMIGSAAGLVLALAFGRILGSLLYQTPTRDPVMLAVTASVILLVASIAGLVPATRATRIDPMVALRWE